MNTVCILYICTGNYVDFWDGFYSSCEKHFMPKMPKSYLVYTDSPSSINYNESSRVDVIKKDCLGWPLDTLLRFRYFLDESERILTSKYVFFFNANAQFMQDVFVSDVLNHSGLTGVRHPGYASWRSSFLPYEKNRNSTAYVSAKNKGVYFQGCLSGGHSSVYIEAIKKCHENIMQDLSWNYIARAHDESHINAVYAKQDVLCLSPIYAYPEEYPALSGVKIMMRQKSRFSWYSSINKATSKPGGFLIKKIKRIILSLVVKK